VVTLHRLLPSWLLAWIHRALAASEPNLLTGPPRPNAAETAGRGFLRACEIPLEALAGRLQLPYSGAYAGLLFKTHYEL